MHQIPSKIHTITPRLIVVQPNQLHIASTLPCDSIQPTHNVYATPVRSNPAKSTSSTRLPSGTMSVHPAEILWHQMLFNQPTLSTRHACGSPNKTHFVNETLVQRLRTLYNSYGVSRFSNQNPLRHCGTQLNSTNNFRSTSNDIFCDIKTTNQHDSKQGGKYCGDSYNEFPSGS
jgi:hypothetical protein